MMDWVHLYILDASSAAVEEIVAFAVGMNLGLYCLQIITVMLCYITGILGDIYLVRFAENSTL